MPPGTQVDGLPAEIHDLLERLVTSDDLELPMLPSVVAELVSLCGADDTDAARLCEVVHRDPVLASHILRVTNSPAYMGSVPIVSLQQAIARLGFAQLGEITMATTLRGKVFASEPKHLVAYIWKHSLATGYLAKEIARMLRLNVDSAFLCGLLHDVGRVVVLGAIRDSSSGLKHEPTVLALHEAMDCYACKMGARLAETWNLPEQVHETVLHLNDSGFLDRAREGVLVTTLACQLALVFEDDSDSVDLPALLEHPVLEVLSIYPEDLERILALKDSVLKRVEAVG